MIMCCSCFPNDQPRLFPHSVAPKASCHTPNKTRTRGNSTRLTPCVTNRQTTQLTGGTEVPTSVHCHVKTEHSYLHNPACIATRCGLDGPRIESRWGARFSAPVQTGPVAHTTSYTMGTGSFPGVRRPGRGVDKPAPLAPRLKKK
jgi:hypothetical protein